MTATWQLHIVGKVQGVWYRASTQQKAAELGLAGWVKNNPDGSVLLQAQGELSALSALEQWCWQGPPLAKVTKVSKQEVASLTESNTFEVVR